MLHLWPNGIAAIHHGEYRAEIGFALGDFGRAPILGVVEVLGEVEGAGVLGALDGLAVVVDPLGDAAYTPLELAADDVCAA